MKKLLIILCVFLFVITCIYIYDKYKLNSFLNKNYEKTSDNYYYKEYEESNYKIYDSYYSNTKDFNREYKKSGEVLSINYHLGSNIISSYYTALYMFYELDYNIDNQTYNCFPLLGNENNEICKKLKIKSISFYNFIKDIL